MKRGAESAKVFSRDLNKIGAQATQLGSALTKTLTLPILGVSAGAIKMSMDFETAFAGVKKTLAGTPAQLAQLNAEIRALAKSTPVSAAGIAKIAESAGQLGVGRDQVAAFSKTIIDISTATNLTADEAGVAFAKLANVMHVPQEQFANLGSAVYQLGNFGASTEQEMLGMAQRIAAAGASAGISAPQVLGIANALASVGIEAEAGGTAVSRVITKIATDVSSGKGHLDDFAKVAGVSAKEFQVAWGQDAGAALAMFFQGLARVKDGGESLFATMDELGFKEVRLKNAMLSAANAGDLMADSIKLGNAAFKDTSKFTAAAEERFKTTANALKILWNRITDVGITIGNALKPAMDDAIKLFDRLLPLLDRMAKTFAGLPVPVRDVAVALGLIAAAAGPALLVFGQLAFAASALAKVFTTGGLLAGVGKFVGLASSGSGVITALGTAFEVLTGPVGWIIGGTAALLTATGTWGDFFRILKAGADIIKNVVVAAFREFIIPILGGFFDIGKRAAGFIDGIFGISTSIKFLGETFRGALKWAADFLETLEMIGDVDIAPHVKGPAGIVAPGAKTLDPAAAWAEMDRADAKRTASTATVTDATKKHAEAVQALIDKMGGKEAIDAANLWLEALPQIGGMTNLTKDDQVALTGVLDAALDAYRRMGQEAPVALRRIALEAHLVSGVLTEMQQRVVAAAAAITKASVGASVVHHPNFNLLEGFSLEDLIKQGELTRKQTIPHVSAAAAANIAAATPGKTSIFGGLNLGTTAPQAILAAITGGGNVAQALASTTGAQIGTNLVTRFGATITEKLGKTFGGAINAVLPGLGALAGPLISLVGKLFGKSEESAKVSPLRDEFFKMQGGLETLNPKVMQLAGNLNLVDAVFKAKTVDQYNKAIKDLTDLLGQTEIASQALDAAVQKYGISIDELGPKFGQQRLDEMAGQLLQDYKLLIGSGIENDVVLRHMADSFQNLAATALKTGTEIPENLKPALQRLVEMGLLVDANGDKLTDLSGINFSEPMSRGFDRVVAAINKLIKALGFATDEADSLAQDRDFEIHGQVVIDGDNLPTGDFRLPQPYSGEQPAYESFASGSGGIRDFGTGKPAMLHGREAVLTESQLSGLGGPSVVHLSVAVYPTEGELKDPQAFGRMMTRVMEDDIAGSYTAIKIAARRATQ